MSRRWMRLEISSMTSRQWPIASLASFSSSGSKAAARHARRGVSPRRAFTTNCIIFAALCWAFVVMHADAYVAGAAHIHPLPLTRTGVLSA